MALDVLLNGKCSENNVTKVEGEGRDGRRHGISINAQRSIMYEKTKSMNVPLVT